MTGRHRGPSLLQAREPCPHTHTHSFLHRFRRSLHRPRSLATRQYDNDDDANHCSVDKPPVSDGDLKSSDDLVQHDPAEYAQDANVDAPATDDEDKTPMGANSLESSDEHDLFHHDPNTYAREANVNPAAKSVEGYLTRTIQTISLVHYVDSAGSVYDIKTIYATPNIITVDPSSGEAIATATTTRPSPFSPGISPAGSNAEHEGLAIPTPPRITPKPSPPAAYAPLGIAEARNATLSSLQGNSSFLSPPHAGKSSVYRPFAQPGTSIQPTSSEENEASESQPYSTTKTTTSRSAYSEYSTYTTTTPPDVWTTTDAPGELPTSNPPSSEGGADEGHGGGINLSPQQKQVIGGVVGSVVGVAFIGVLLILYLRYKRRKGHATLLDAHSPPTAARSLGGDQSEGGSTAGVVADRSAAPGPIAAAFASLTGKKPAPVPPSEPTEGGERKFYRVSGRKLPSVLVSGGDGYADPRESVVSGNSDYYRGSQAFEPDSEGTRQLTLGSPMRPVSGVPIMRSGPARLPVTRNPFDESEPPARPTTSSSQRPGAQERPGASGSRFQERV